MTVLSEEQVFFGPLIKVCADGKMMLVCDFRDLGDKVECPVVLELLRKCWVIHWEERFFILSVKNNNGMKLNVFMIGRKEDLNNYRVEISVEMKLYWVKNFEKEREEFSCSFTCSPNYFEIENKDDTRGLIISKDMLDDDDCVDVCLSFEKTS